MIMNRWIVKTLSTNDLVGSIKHLTLFLVVSVCLYSMFVERMSLL